MLEALEASSLHGFQRSTVATRTIFREPLHCREKHEQKTVFCSRRLKKRNRIPVSSIVSAGNVIEGNLSCLTCLFGRNRRPSPQCLRLLPLLRKLHQTRVLVEQIAAGSKPAMQALFARHRTYVYRWLLRFVSNETLAEDLLSEVFLDVWRQAGRFQCPLFRLDVVNVDCSP